jgi:iron-sulfur cluster assembly accessory protein
MTVENLTDTEAPTHGVELTDAAAAKARALLDRMSTPYLQGAVIDFVDTIEKQGFTIDNPNAGGSCACGDSFN